MRMFNENTHTRETVSNPTAFAEARAWNSRLLRLREDLKGALGDVAQDIRDEVEHADTQIALWGLLYGFTDTGRS